MARRGSGGGSGHVARPWLRRHGGAAALGLGAVAVFWLGVTAAYTGPWVGAGVERLVGSFAPSLVADYSQNTGGTFARQRPFSPGPVATP
jgi:hypothetical protein